MERKDENIISTGDELKEKIDNFLDDNPTSYSAEPLAKDVSDISDKDQKEFVFENKEGVNNSESEKNSTSGDEEDKIESINNILKNSNIIDKDDLDSQTDQNEDNAGYNQKEAEELNYGVENSLQKPTRKKIHIHVPLIIASCILVGAILGYLVFTLFFLHSPLGTWSIKTEDDITYYYTFEKDFSKNNALGNDSLNGNVLKMTIGSIDYIGAYALSEDSGKKTINIEQYYGALSGQYEYYITGSKLLGNQEFHLVNGDQEYTLTKAKIPNDLLTVSEDFKEDKNLTGEWEHVFEDYGGLTYTFKFNKDGTMQINQYDTYIYNCTYTCDGSNIKCTYCSLEEVTEDIEYSCDGETLTIMGLECQRAGKSTADQK